MSLWVWLATLSALAADGGAWVGTWALDVMHSDDPMPRITSAVRAPVVAGAGAAGMSPDGGGGEVEDSQRKVVDMAAAMLARSGQVTFRDATDLSIEIEYGGEQAVTVPWGRKGVKALRSQGKVRIRATVDDHFVVRRRMRTVNVTETFLPLNDKNELVVVVRVDGSGIDPVEFRRVYRALHATEP